MNNVCLCVFAKAPVSGQVKTRLIPAVNAQQACSIHEHLLQHCLQQTKASAWTTLLWSTDIQHPSIQECSKKYAVELRLQQGDDLGERMGFAVKDALKTFSYVIIIGTDCPSIDTAMIEESIQQLTSGIDVVIAPAADGGYVLIAFSNEVASVFDNVKWGSDQVLIETRQRLQQAGVRHHELATQRDIDRPEDLAYLEQQYPALLTQ